VTEITLKLAVIPQQTTVAVVTFPTIRDAAAAASRVMRAGVPVASMEIMDEVQMMVVNKAGSTGKTWKEVPTLFFKFSGTKAGVQDNIATVKEIAKRHKAGEFEFARNDKEAKLLWSARKESLWSMLALRKRGEEVWSTDVAVPLSRLADIIGAYCWPKAEPFALLIPSRNLQKGDGLVRNVRQHPRPYWRRQLS
jgi:D-lactate dehydrogenase (cytochrome)